MAFFNLILFLLFVIFVNARLIKVNQTEINKIEIKQRQHFREM